MKSLIKLYLLKYQVYKDKTVDFFNSNLYKIDIELKQILKIIYLYKTNKKKIMFIGFPLKKSISSQYFFISKKYYLKKMLGNNSYLLLKQKKPKLIVFNNVQKKDAIIVNELKNFKIPLILLGNTTKLECKNYYFNADLKSNKIKNFCFFLIYSILIKPIKI